MKNLDELEKELHKEGITILEYDGMKIPCIIIKDDKFNNLIRFNDKPTIVDSRLDIWHDDNGKVFVNIIIEFKGYDKIQALLYANNCLQFFEALAEYGMIALMPEHYSNNTNILMIQLAKKDRMEEALDNIRSYMKV